MRGLEIAARSVSFQLQPALGTPRGWLGALALVATAHAGIWAALEHRGTDVAARALPAVQVALIAPPAPEPPAVTPLQASNPSPAIKLRRRTEAPRPEPKVVPPTPSEEIAPIAKATPEPPVSPPTLEPEPVTAPAPPPVAAAAPAPAEYVEPIYRAAYLNNPPPAYPMAARRRGIEGTVIIRVEISEGGDPRQAFVKTSSGHRMLDQAALDAVRGWRFAPARRGTQPVAAWVDVPISFRLDA